MKRLIEIQSELKAPKSQTNTLGGYKYRNCEDILEALKPLLKPRNLLIFLNDEIAFIEGRFYVKSTATLWDAEVNKELTHTVAYAREEETKPKMDGSQVTGSASSYARKYALNGLFAIDDTKDSDATNTHGKEDKKKNEIPTDDENREIDIFEGLKATSSSKEAFKYFNEYKDKVNDKTAFRKAWQEHIKTFGGSNE